MQDAGLKLCVSGNAKRGVWGAKVEENGREINGRKAKNHVQDILSLIF